MKSRTKLLTNHNGGGRPLNLDSKAKIYVPISIANQNRQLGQEDHQGPSDYAISELKKANLQFKEKQQIYIDKLIKLEEGLEKQHLEFRQLQDLYNQLLNSYKHKQQEISELQQKYRESNRKKETVNYVHPPPPKQQDTQNKKQIDDQRHITEKLEMQLTLQKQKNGDLAKTVERLLSENSYYKNKDKMNDSRASLNSKVFEELGQWQKQADLEKEEKIKLDYENKFLKSRNLDLERRVGELEQLLLQKQTEALKLRQNNIILCRENSESRFRKSSSRSPRKSDQKERSDNKKEKSIGKNTLLDQLYEQNKILKKELEIQKAKRAESSTLKNEYFIKQEQFYSFSQDDHSNHSSNQESQQQNKSLHKELFIKVEHNFEVLRKGDFQEQPNFAEALNHSNESLQELPAELEIEHLISKNKKKDGTEES